MIRRTVLILALIFWALAAQAGEIHLFAAASLGDALREICAGYAQVQPQAVCITNLAGSGTLARQVLAGAPADLCISANPRWLDELVAAGKVDAATRSVLAGNTLVFVGAPGVQAAQLVDLRKLGRIALGSPDSVPAGDYARGALVTVGLYDELVAAGRLVFAQDVRQALAYAERGVVDGAFVYGSDARLAKRARVLFPVPAGLYPPVRYPMALTGAGRANPEAVAFYRYLRGDAAARTLEEHGFAAPLAE